MPKSVRKKAEALAKKKFPNDPKALEKAILESKNLWLTKERMNSFLTDTVNRSKPKLKTTTSAVQATFTYRHEINTTSSAESKLFEIIDKHTALQASLKNTIVNEQKSIINKQNLRIKHLEIIRNECLTELQQELQKSDAWSIKNSDKISDPN